MERIQRKYRIFLGTIILLILAGLWYTRPLSFSQLCPGIDLAEPSSTFVIYDTSFTHPNGKVDSSMDGFGLLSSECPSFFQELSQILERQAYHRRVTSLLPRWITDLYLYSDDYKIEDWKVGISARDGSWDLDVDTYGTRMWLTYQGGGVKRDVFCHAKDQRTFHQEVYDLLVRYKREDV